MSVVTPMATLYSPQQVTLWADFVVKVAGGRGCGSHERISRPAAVRTRHLRFAADGSELEKDTTNRTLGARDARGWR
jgi:hypothetical protein